VSTTLCRYGREAKSISLQVHNQQLSLWISRSMRKRVYEGKPKLSGQKKGPTQTNLAGPESTLDREGGAVSVGGSYTLRYQCPRSPRAGLYGAGGAASTGPRSVIHDGDRSGCDHNHSRSTMEAIAALLVHTSLGS
jgi:hypothetical protein